MTLYQENTTNHNFIEMTRLLKKEGSLSFKKILRIKNNDVKKIDPWASDLTDEQKELVLKEARDNIWYFLREVVRINNHHYQLTEALFLLFDSAIKCREVITVTSRQNGYGTALMILSKWRQLKDGVPINIFALESLDRDYLLSKEEVITLPDYFDLGLYIPTVLNDNNIKSLQISGRPIVYSKVLSIMTMQKITEIEAKNPNAEFLFISKRAFPGNDSSVLSDEYKKAYNDLFLNRREIDIKNTHMPFKGRFFIK